MPTIVPRVALAIGLASAVALLSGAACGGRSVVPLLSSAGIPLTHTPARTVPLEVVTRSTAVDDPLPVNGTDVAFGDFESALGFAVSSAAVPWADAHRDRRPGGWAMLVEVTNAEADWNGARVIVTIGVRATLRTRIGGTYIAQTIDICRQGGAVEPREAASVVYRCMMRVGRDLTAWLDAVEPEQPRVGVTVAPGGIGGGLAGAGHASAEGGSR